MQKVIVLTGASGNMGREVLNELYTLPDVKIRILNYDDKRFGGLVKRKYAGVETVEGNIADETVCKILVEGADYVINCAAVIPPKSDKHPEKALECNYYGVKSLIDAVKSCKPEPKLIHVSTVALYGNRNYLHPWGRVGDPLMPSVYDVYAKSKLFGERLVLESGIEKWAVLRQTAMLHDRMLADNMSDGLMFHTCLNSPLEWVTAKDSGLLIKNIVEKDINNEAEGFWRKVYNIGGGEKNRNTGYDTFNDGFSIIGGSAKQFLLPEWHADRNFHGVWFYDGDELENEFRYQRQDCSDYWREILKKHPYYAIAKAIPSGIIKKFAVERLLNNYNAPTKWQKNGEEGKLRAYFYSDKRICGWGNFPLLREGKTPSGEIDYNNLKDKKCAERLLLSHGFDENKGEKEITVEDLKQAAAFRGGKCLSEKYTGDLYVPLEWECADGHRFFASPYTVLFGGHWCEECLKNGWDYDNMARKSEFFAQVYYDSHDKNERRFYYFKNGDAEYKEIV
ncbi:MAG: NAD-dependent epimerase/dehydratase family protein [Christensenellales bacterium]